MPAGRPALYNNCMDFSAMCEMYFEECDAVMGKHVDKEGNIHDIPDPDPYLISGLCLFVGMHTDTLIEYGTKPEFSAIVKRAKLRVKNKLEMTSMKKPSATTGCIFNLKCNHKMVETSKLEVAADINMEARIRAQVEAELLGEGLEKIGASSHAEGLLNTRS